MRGGVGAPDEVLPARPDADEAAGGLEELVELGGGDPPLEADAPLLALGLDDLRLSPIESGRWNGVAQEDSQSGGIA